MKRFLILLLLVSGCRTWDVNVLGVPIGEEPRYMTASSDLTTDEKIGVIVVLAVAIGGTIAIALAASN